MPENSIKIAATLGPACDDNEILEAMLREGMTALRLNLSHTSMLRALPRLVEISALAERLGFPLELIIDIEGPELRLGTLPAPLILGRGAHLTLGQNGIPVPELLLQSLAPGDELHFDDGKLTARVLSTAEGTAELELLRGGTLGSRKSIAVIGKDIVGPVLSTKDLEDLSHIREVGISGIMQPFVRSAEDCRLLRRDLRQRFPQSSDIRILAKIENTAGLQHLDEIIEACDEVVIARGDLGNLFPLPRVPRIQKTIAARCAAKGRPFTVVTQLLAGMVQNPIPTRAEVSDIFNAVLDGASTLMVTNETASGRHPVEVIRTLKACSDEALAYLHEQS